MAYETSERRCFVVNETSDSRRLRRALWPAFVWSGLLSGLIEVAILALRKSWFEKTLPLSSQFVWMVPVVAVVLSAALGLFLLCTARLLPEKIVSRVIIFSLAFLACLGPLFAIPRLHYSATLLLAAGFATQAARYVAKRMDRCFALAPRAIGWMSALVICLGLGVNGSQDLEERQALATLPPARAGAPHVLLIVLDTVRAESLSLYGYTKPTTPGLERLAKAAVVFNAAISTSPWTLPSHASMFTGRLPHELSADWRNPLDGTYPTLAEVLRAHGYATAGFVANLIYGGSGYGLDRGFAHYEDFPVSLEQAVLSSSLGSIISGSYHLRRWLNYHRVLNRKTAGEVNEEFLRWLSRRDQRPFFAFLNYMDAHEPYLPPKPFDRQFGPPRQRADFMHTPTDAFHTAKWAMSEREVQAESAAYDGTIAYIDHELGRLIDELTQRGLLENTLLIVVADHGEHLGEHRLFGHGNSLYRTVLHVPLLISFRNQVPPGTIIQEPVTLSDIPATVMELIGEEGGTSLPGTSLSRYWQQPTENRRSRERAVISEANQRVFGVQQPWYPLSKGNMTSVVDGGYHYIRHESGGEELYDFEQDRAEDRDLAGSDEGRQIINRFGR